MKELLDDWSLLGRPKPTRKRKGSRSSRVPPSAQEVLATLEGHTGVVSVRGPSPQVRAGVYGGISEHKDFRVIHEGSRDWLTQDPLESTLQRLRGDDVWLRSLIAHEDLKIETPLKQITDRPYGIPAVVSRLVLVCRFEGNPTYLTGVLDGGAFPEGVTDQMGLFTTPLRPLERLEALLFCLAWARQNNTVGRTILVVDDLEYAVLRAEKDRLRALYSIVEMIARWSRVLSTDLTALVGYDETIQRGTRKLGTAFQEVLARGPILG